MIAFPNAKINLGLQIVSKRADGYHNLETIFYPLKLRDALEVIPSKSNKQYRFFQSGIKIQGNVSDNLVIKAWELIADKHEIGPIDIHLLKKIPFGGGLGGGSSDAAAMLKLMNDTFSLGYTIEALHQLAVKLGADCPFFLYNKPAFASGIGDQLEAIELDLSRYFLVLVKPDCLVSTKEAYTMVSPLKPEFSLKQVVKRPLSEWRGRMKNDFEPSVFNKFPEIYRIKETLYDMGATYASMSGSGATVFGIFESQPQIENRFVGHFLWKSYEL